MMIACGGGGIPVIREGRHFAGVDAVIDKDLASALLAQEVKADFLVIATDVEGVALRYGLADQRFLRTLTPAQATEHLQAGEFPPGSMGPKVEACLRFLRHGGKRAVVCSLDAIEDGVAATAGTQFLPS